MMRIDSSMPSARTRPEARSRTWSYSLIAQVRESIVTPEMRAANALRPLRHNSVIQDYNSGRNDATRLHQRVKSARPAGDDQFIFFLYQSIRSSKLAHRVARRQDAN